MSAIEIRFKRGEEWVSFPVSDILHMPLRHACHLFSGVYPVVAKQSGAYVVNSADLQKQYRIKRRRVSTFADILASGGDRLDKKLSVVGFI
jgi:hypothetical protein